MRVLLIEDDVTTSAKIEVILQNEDIVCDVTDLGEDGLQQGKLYDYDIIILDLLLPDMDGYEVLRRLRAVNACLNHAASTLRRMPPPQRKLIRFAREKLFRAYIREAARLRGSAATATTAPLKTRLLEEVEQQERLADEIIKRD
jgi:CheY-like chemotaxis protein